MSAAQLKVPTGIWTFYADRDQTRREHLAELQEQFGYQTFTRAHYRQFGSELAALADQTHQGMLLVQLRAQDTAIISHFVYHGNFERLRPTGKRIVLAGCRLAALLAGLLP